MMKMTMCLIRRFSTVVQKTKIVRDAEKAVGYTSSFLSLQWILKDEVANIGSHIRKLIATEHPIIKVTMKLFLSNELTWGLVLLLITKMAGLNPNLKFNDLDWDRTAGILHKQRVIAEVLEMLRTSNSIHKGINNLDMDNPNFKDLHYGNKIALLGGDYLLGRSFHELALLKNFEIQGIFSSTIRDLSEAEFIGLRDCRNRPLPSKPTPNQSYKVPKKENYHVPFRFNDYMGNMKAEWTLRNILNGGSLLGLCCKCSMILALHNEKVQNIAYDVGESFALLHQASTEQKSFENGDDFNLVSIPVMFHLDHDPSFYKEIEKGLTDVNLIDFNCIRRIVSKGPALERTKDLIDEYSRKTISLLDHFEDCESKRALINIIKSL